jgi:hypothetical protein
MRTRQLTYRRHPRTGAWTWRGARGVESRWLDSWFNTLIARRRMMDTEVRDLILAAGHQIVAYVECV